MKLSSRVSHLEGSSILEVSAQIEQMKKKGIDVINLTAGETDFKTPQAICDAATKAMQEGITRYAPAAGFPKVREAIAQMVSKDWGAEVKPEEVALTAGAKHALFLSLQALLEPGDEVLIFNPAWVSYIPMIELAGGKVVSISLSQKNSFVPTSESLKKIKVSKKTKGILVNSPNNPTGAVYPKEILEQIAQWALKKGLWILSDEVYEKLVYDGEHVPIATLSQEVRKSTITVSAFSKTYAMTGWRFGWAITDPKVIQKIAALESQSISHITSFVQWAGLAACELEPSVLSTMRDAFMERRKFCLERFKKISMLSTAEPAGAFYFFVDISKTRMTDVQFCKGLLDKSQVGVVPGSGFGSAKHFRMSYATSLENLKKAFDRIESFI